MATDSRRKQIIKTSIIGIAANAVLAGFKLAVGLITGSIAIVLDAVNNVSAALSSVITVLGTKIAGKPADKKHPYGYGRIEYLTSVLIASIVLVAGILSMKESIEKIITPTAADYSVVSLIIIGGAVIVKLFMGLYVRKVGKELNSGALVSSGTDALYKMTGTELDAVFISAYPSRQVYAVDKLTDNVYLEKADIDALDDKYDFVFSYDNEHFDD